MPVSDLSARLDELIATLRARGANLAVASGAEAVEQGLEQLVARGVVVIESDRLRVRDRIVMRYYARTIQHLLPSKKATH